LVGEPPLIQALAAGVAYPSPKVLSRNAQRNSKPTTTRVMARSLLARVLMIAPNVDSVRPVRSVVGVEPSSLMYSRMAIVGLLFSLPAVSLRWRIRAWAERPASHVTAGRFDGRAEV
jgi:hypothetical protein